MKLDDLKGAIGDGSVDTVLLAIADMEGRLQGKRLTAQYFLDETLEHGAEGCNYLLAVDVDMDTVDGLQDVFVGARVRRLRDEAGPGYAAARAVARGHRDAAGRCRSGTTARTSSLRRGRSCAASSTASPSEGCRPTLAPSSSSSSSGQLRGGVEEGYRDLEPANLYNVDYSLLGTARVEPLIRRIRNEMAGAGMTVENSKGECNFGQHEINFRYGEALAAADEHAIYKTGAKEIAAQEGWRSPSSRSSTSSRATRATSTSRSRTRRARTPSPPTSRCSTASSRANSPACAS